MNFIRTKLQIRVRGSKLNFLVPFVLFGLQGVAAAVPIQVVPNEYIIQRRPPVLAPGVKASAVAYEVRKQTRFFDVAVPASARFSANASGGRTEDLNWVKVRSDCEMLKRDPSVLTCEPNIIRKLLVVPNDPSFSLQWALDDPSHNADIGAPAAWNVGTGNKDTLIGVIDSGIYAPHPDLAANLWANPADPVDGIDNDHNGYIDDVYGVSTYTGSSNVGDCNGHGSHVSGIIGAVGNNGTGVAGVNWTTSLVVVSTDSDCEGTAPLSAIISAYDYFTDLKQSGHNIRVVNASFGGDSPLNAEKQAIERLKAADILLVAAAGNDNQSIDAHPSYPASYDVSNIIVVGATGPTRERAYYSNYGQGIDIMAPGGDVNYAGGRIKSTYSLDAAGGGGLYALLQGTSMATPMVTGAIGLLASQRSYLTGTNLHDILLASATYVPGLAGLVSGGRFLNAAGMSQYPDPTDNCPTDPNKLSPGNCGCGVPETYTDTDGDGTVDCADGCPTDASKVSAGVCGCGVSERDFNGDGQIECGPNIASLTPRRATLKVSRGRLVVGMEALARVRYIIEVVTSKRARGSRRTIRSGPSFYATTGSKASLKKPSRGSAARVRYAFTSASDSSVRSRWSRTATLVISR